MLEAIALIIILLIIFNLDKIATFFVSLFYILLLVLVLYILFKILSAICNYCEKKSAKKAAEAAAKAEEERKKAKEAVYNKQLNSIQIKEAFFKNNESIFRDIVNKYLTKEPWILKQDNYESGTRRSLFINEKNIYVYLGSGPANRICSALKPTPKWPEEILPCPDGTTYIIQRHKIDIRNELKLLIPDIYQGIEKKVLLVWFAEGIKHELKKIGVYFTDTQIEAHYRFPIDTDTSEYYHYFEFNVPGMEMKTLN